MNSGAITSGIYLAVDNPGFRPAVFEGGLKRRRAFEAKFRLVRNQLPVPYDPRIAALHGADRRVMQNVIGFARTGSKPSAWVSAVEFANWLEQSHNEHCARHVAQLESVAFTDCVPSDAVIAESIRIMQSRGIAVKTRHSDRGTSFFMVRRWS